MSAKETLLVAAAGMITPVGVGLAMTNASVRARICAYEKTDIIDLDHIDDNDDNPIRMALVPTPAIENAIDPKKTDGSLSEKQVRMLGLATAALSEIAPKMPSEPVPLFLAGPEPYGFAPSLDHTFLNNLSLQSGIAFDIPSSRLLNTGRAGAIDVIETAFKFLQASDAPYALVGGVDTFFDVYTMFYLKKANRLLRFDSFDGFIPGEGAAFLLLASPHASQVNTNVCLYRPGMAYEEGNILSDGAEYRADALSSAFAQSIAANPNKINCIYSSENGEFHYAKELSVAIARSHRFLTDSYTTLRPAEYFGDLGAAFGFVALGMASTNVNADESSLVYCSSDSGLRAALCVSAT